MSKGVYKYTIERPDVRLAAHGVSVSAFFRIQYLGRLRRGDEYELLTSQMLWFFSVRLCIH